MTRSALDGAALTRIPPNVGEGEVPTTETTQGRTGMMESAVLAGRVLYNVPEAMELLNLSRTQI